MYFYIHVTSCTKHPSCLLLSITHTCIYMYTMYSHVLYVPYRRKLSQVKLRGIATFRESFSREFLCRQCVVGPSPHFRLVICGKLYFRQFTKVFTHESFPAIRYHWYTNILNQLPGGWSVLLPSDEGLGGRGRPGPMVPPSLPLTPLTPSPTAPWTPAPPTTGEVSALLLPAPSIRHLPRRIHSGLGHLLSLPEQPSTPITTTTTTTRSFISQY